MSNGLRDGRAFMPVNNREDYGSADYEFKNLADGDGEGDKLSLDLTPEQSALIQSNEYIESVTDGETKNIVLNMKKLGGHTFLNFHFGEVDNMKLLKTKEACSMLHVSASFLLKLVREKKIKSYKLGRLRRFSFHDILNYLTENIEK
ncbi:hypothetical protein SCALIN_C28_0202 [Candidatus Scalindua japonica]|uniref:Helix-turn-helix domain-containing protein n=2 Tax=Candidatus Scalindua japonica TaxID=1284222 RepID=A0A286U1H9_9BACT|nr:hypothetical protein SCALIN_C28_0202 [Candidatus Scalindua japonica]